jgi:hypothetical protein
LFPLLLFWCSSSILLYRASWWCPKGFPLHDRCLLFILLTCHADYTTCDVGAQFTFLQLALLLCFAPLLLCVCVCLCLSARFLLLSRTPVPAACASRSGCATTHSQHRSHIYTGTRSYTHRH